MRINMSNPVDRADAVLLAADTLSMCLEEARKQMKLNGMSDPSSEAIVEAASSMMNLLGASLISSSIEERA